MRCKEIGIAYGLHFSYTLLYRIRRVLYFIIFKSHKPQITCLFHLIKQRMEMKASVKIDLFEN